MEAVPELRDAYANELEWLKDETPGQYIIFEDILKPYLISLLESPGNDEVLGRIFGFLEKLALSDAQDLRNLFYIALIENDEIALRDDLYQRSCQFMGEETLQVATGERQRHDRYEKERKEWIQTERTRND